MKLKILAILFLLSPLGFTLPVEAIETFASPEHPEVMPLTQNNSQNWHEHTADKFTIQMPAEPITNKTSEEIAEGFTLTFNEITVETGNGAYALIHTELPDDYIQETNSEEVLDDMSYLFLIGTPLEGLKALEQSIDFRGNPGREYRISEPDVALVLRLYLVEKRMYFLFAVSEQQNQVNQFVNSFNLR
jgi:hypothetical protein